MASKLLNKIGVGKKHKQTFEVTTQPPAPAPAQPPLLVRDCGEYTLPPDCQSEDSVYCEPADSLNTTSSTTTTTVTTPTTATTTTYSLTDSLASSTSAFTPTGATVTAPATISTVTITALEDSSISSTLSSTASTKDNSRLNVSHTPLSPTSTLQSDTSYCPDENSSSSASPTHSRTQATDMTVTPHIDSITSTKSTDSLPTEVLTEHSGGGSGGSHVPMSSTVESDSPTALYMNNSQIQAVRSKCIDGKSRSTAAVSNITPDIDPRNIHYPVHGNEYESPWDLESEIIEVVKQMKQPLSPTPSSTQGLLQQSVVSKSPTNPPGSTTSPSQHTRPLVEPATGLKINYDARSGTSSHKVKHPSVHRQSSSSGTSKQEVSSSQVPSTSAVLVEGKWRETKQHQPPVTSPISPPKILSHSGGASNSSNSGGANKHSANQNTATNFIYDKSNDSEIKVMLKYPDDKSKVPCAQPRLSLTSPPVMNSDDQVYENFKDAKKGPVSDYHDADGVYDDPWNVEQVQQQIFDELERKQKVSSEQRQRRASEELTSERRKPSERSSQKKRPTDLPSESGSYRADDSSGRRVLPAAASKIHKLSPRALPGTPALPTTPAPPKTPQIPANAPGQAHANKPVLVVHKTNTYTNSHDRRGSSSSRSGSIRKTPSTPGEVPECQHRVGLGVNKSLPLTQQPWYHGAIQRNHAEELLRRQPDGSFLIRESSNSPRDKTLSLKNASGFIHIKIVQQPDGTVILGQFSHPFKNIMEMVEYYSRHKVNIKGAEHTYLEIPVMRDR